jgi:site-specific recombinase XerC
MLDSPSCSSSPTGARPSPGRAPANKGRRYPADPPRVEEIVAVMRQAGDRVMGRRTRGLIVVLWRAGLRISEALALAESDLEPRRGSLLVRSGKGGKMREVGMDEWGWDQLRPWLEVRLGLPVGPLFCVIKTREADGRGQARQSVSASALGGTGRRQAPLRAAPTASRPTVEMAREGVPLNVIQRQLGHANLGVTPITCRGSTAARSSIRCEDGGPRSSRRLQPSSPSYRVSSQSGYPRGTPRLIPSNIPWPGSL